ncbi:MAG: site-2 protease family protein [Armatimonadota bacterium]
MLLGNFDFYEFILFIIVLVICITVHEFAHAYSAYKAGDNTPKYGNRLNLNPMNHFEPFGAIMIVISAISGFGIGWGKPVGVNPHNFRNPRWDNLKVSLWGPLSNILMAAIGGGVLRLLFYINFNDSFILSFLVIFVLVNLGLALFNLIPITPLDGSHILSALLPEKEAIIYDSIMHQYGFLIFIGLIILAPSILPIILGPPRKFLFTLFTGL